MMLTPTKFLMSSIRNKNPMKQTRLMMLAMRDGLKRIQKLENLMREYTVSHTIWISLKRRNPKMKPMRRKILKLRPRMRLRPLTMQTLWSWMQTPLI